MVNDIDVVFAALADPTRRRIVERLARKPLTVGEIAADFPISQPAISKHVRTLEDAGVLVRRVEGRTHYCTISPRAMSDLATWIERQRRFWNGTLDRLEGLIAAKAHEKRNE